MRTEKFDNSREAYNSDDIKYAFENNGLAAELDEIDVIVAEICGENDEYSWYWILLMKDGSYANAQGSCDYSGWACRSDAEINKGYKTPEEAINSLDTNGDSRRIEDVLLKQITGEIPFAIYH